MTINEIQDNVIEEFSAFDDWMDKYSLLIDLGNSLPALDERYKTESNLIEGCRRVNPQWLPSRPMWLSWWLVLKKASSVIGGI